MEYALRETYAAIPAPKIVITILDGLLRLLGRIDDDRHPRKRQPEKTREALISPYHLAPNLVSGK